MVKQQKSSKSISKKKSVVKNRNVANKKSIESHGFAFFNSDEYRERIRTIKVNFLLMKLRFGIKIKKIINFLNFKAQQEITFLRDSWMPITVKPFLVFQGLAVFALFIALADFLMPPVKLDKSLVLQTSVTKQITNVVAGGSPVKWTSLVRRGDITDGKYLLTIPKSAQNIKIKTIDNNQAESILNSPTQDITSLEKKKNIAKSNQPRSLFIADVANSMKKLMLSSVEVAVQSIVDASNEQVQEVEDVKVVDLSKEIIEINVEKQSNPEVLINENSVDIVKETENLSLETVVENSDENKTTSSQSETYIDENIQSASGQVIIPPVDEIIAVEYEIPAPQIVERETDTGKVVSVSSDVELINAEGKPTPLTDVLAFTNIPEIYKVGQESKVKIKWTNNNNKNVTFNVYDTNSNGKLDYVEWTVPHLSTQTFEIIFISKAFQLDSKKDIVADIYNNVKARDGNWASITTGQYVRVTFEKILNNRNDITLYAKPTNPGRPVEIRAYATNTNQLVASFFVNHEGMYKQLIPELSAPTDVFDLQIIGNVDIDYIVDPTGNYALTLDGNGQYATVGDDFGNFDNGLTPFSLSAWVKLQNSGEGGQIIMAKQGNTFCAAPGYHLSVVGGKLAMNLWHHACKGQTMVVASDDAVINDNEWVYVTMTYSGSGVASGIKLYANGQELSKTATSDGLAGLDIHSNFPFSIGGLGDGNAWLQTFEGSIDEALVFNRVLTNNEILSLYNGGSGLYGSIDTAPFNNGLLAGYHFDEGSGGTALDFSGNRNNATITSPTNSSGNYYDTGYVVAQNGDLVGPTISITSNVADYISGSPDYFMSGSPDYFTVSATDETELGSIIPNLDSSLVAWWRMTEADGATLDDSVGIYNGIGTGLPSVSGKRGYAMDFRTGSNDYFALNSNLGLGGTNSATISLWMKADNYETYRGIFSDLVDDSNDFTLTLDIFEGIDFSLDEGCDINYQNMPNPYDWHYITATYNGSTMRIYDNGSLVSEGSCNRTITTENFQIGNDRNNGGRYFNGSMDDLMIFNRALSPAEILGLYNGTSITYNSSVLSQGSHTFVAYAEDVAGNVSTSNGGTFIVDTTNPTISVTSPTNGSTNGPLVSFGASATDTNLGFIVPNLDSSLISWWRMDDVDGSGNPTDYIGDNDGTKYGDAIQTNSGKFGKGFVFDGTDDYVLTTYSPNFNPSTTQRTFSVWIKPDNPSELKIFASTPSGSDQRLYFGVDGNYDDKWIINTQAGASGDELHSISSASFDVWSHFVAKFDGAGNMEMYINGVSQGTETVDSYTTTGALSIGALGAGVLSISGLIDDVMIFSRALTSDEITALYNGTSISHTSTLADGSHTYTAYAQDLAGNIATSDLINFSVVINATPNVPTLISPADASYTTDTTPTLSVNYSDSDSGDVGNTNYRISSSSLSDCVNNTNVIAWGTSAETATNNESTTFTPSSPLYTDSTYYWCAQNNDGEATSAWTEMGSFMVDDTSPYTDLSLGEYTSNTWTNSTVTVILACQDTGLGSGCANIYACEDSGSACDPTAGTSYDFYKEFVYSTDTTTTLRWKSKDVAGNWGTSEGSVIVKVDKTAPTASNFSPDNESTINTTYPIITLNTNEQGDCYMSLTNQSYDDMVNAGDVDCEEDETGTTHTCYMTDLGADGEKNIYVACEDYPLTNKDTSSTTDTIVYTLDTSDGIGCEYDYQCPTDYSCNVNNLCVTSIGGSTPANTPSGLSLNVNSANQITVTWSANGNGNDVQYYAENTTSSTNSGWISATSWVATSLSCDTQYTFTVKARNVSNLETATITGTAKTNSCPPIGGGTGILSTPIEILTNVVEKIQELPGKAVEPISTIIEKLIGISEEKNEPKKPEIVYPPIEQVVPEIPQIVFKGGNIISQKQFDKISILPLPESIKDLALKFPSFASTLESVGILETKDVEKLKVVKLKFPSLSEVVGIPSAISVNSLTEDQINKIPSNITFARTGNDNIDFSINVEIDDDNEPIQSIKTIQNKPLYLTIKPENPASSVKGYIIVREAKQKTAELDPESIRNNIIASIVDSIKANRNGEENPEVNMVFNQFDYEYVNGLWTAQVPAPPVDGTYEVKTVVQYAEKTKENKTSESISMILLVDPEGYIYEKTTDNREIRINNAKVSLYWLNPENDKFELWPAKEYLQENPQITDITGKYSFLVPNGKYYLSVKMDGYYDYNGSVFEIKDGVAVHENIELRLKNSILRMFTTERIMMGIAILLLLFIFVTIIIKAKKLKLN